MQHTLFVVDDDPSVLKIINHIFKNSNYDIHLFDSGYKALDGLEQVIPDLVLLDVNMRGLNGIEVLRKIKESHPAIIVIIITGFATIESAIDAMKAGAYDYIQKPFTPAQITRLVANALETLTLKREVDELRNSLLQKNYFRKIIGQSQNMQHLIRQVDQYARSTVPVLIEGEQGTEKETIAEYIHYLSDRFARPYIAVNCGAIRDEHAEQELFGQVDNFEFGHREYIGAFERAEGGTVFLDEIGELSLEMQMKLVTTLEHNQYFAVGCPDVKTLDIRLIAASHVPLELEIEQGRMREELYYQLNVAKISLPPLRERKMDIIPMANYFISHFNALLGKKVQYLSADVEKALLKYSFRGNVWELRNIIERAILLADGDFISVQDLELAGITGHAAGFHIQVKLNEKEDENVIHRSIQDIIRKTLNVTNQNKSRAAKMLGIPRSTLRHYLQRDD